MQKTVLSHTSERLIIGLDFRRRFFLLGFGISLAGLAGVALAALQGSLNIALFGPLLGGLALVGVLGIYRAFRADNDVYDRHSGVFTRYTGNLLSGKRVRLRHTLGAFSRLESEDVEEGVPPRVFLRGADSKLEISDYNHVALRILSEFLHF